MDFIKSLTWRYAVNQFSSQQLTQSQLQPLIDSVHLSASAYGMQPYELLVISDPQLKQQLLPFSYGQDKIANCSHLLVLANRVSTSMEDIHSYITGLADNQQIDVAQLSGYKQTISGDLLSLAPAEQHAWSAKQCYIALGKLLSCAAVNQIDACPMTGFDQQGFNELLGLTARGLNAEIVCPVGIRSHQDHSALRAKYRKPQSQLVRFL